MKERYIRAMDALHRVCLVLSVICLVVMTLIIPWGVFTRYVLNSGSSWPEPMAILLMIVFAFFAAAVCYRDNLHIAVMVVPNMLTGVRRILLGWVAEIGMVSINLFMLVWGLELVHTTWHQTIAEFPALSVGLTYLPIPIGGAITGLFIVERLWKGDFFAQPSSESLSSVTSE